MFHYDRLSALRIALAVFTIVCLSVPTAHSYDLTVRIESTVVPYGVTQGWISVYVTNPTDGVAAYTIWLNLNRPDLIRFDPLVDTVGTLTSGFELLSAHSIRGDWTDLKITAFAEVNPQSPPNPGFGPNVTEQVLLRVPYHLLTVPDSMSDRVATIYIESQLLDAFSFAREDGSSIGVITEERADTAYYRCAARLGQVCVSWQRVAGPPYDSIFVAVDTVAVLDTTAVDLVNGQVTLAPCSRALGELDIDGNGLTLTVADYVALLRYVVGDTSGIADPYAADVTGDCIIDWADAFKLDSLYKWGYMLCDVVPCTVPCACDHTPVRQCCWQSRGNIDGDLNHVVNLVDLSSLVDYLLLGGAKPIRCFDEANINGLGLIDLSDLSMLITYLTTQGAPPLPSCL